MPSPKPKPNRNPIPNPNPNPNPNPKSSLTLTLTPTPTLTLTLTLILAKTRIGALQRDGQSAVSKACGAAIGAFKVRARVRCSATARSSSGWYYV